MYANDNALTKITDFKKLEITFIISQRNSGILHVLIQLLATLFLNDSVITCNTMYY